MEKVCLRKSLSNLSKNSIDTNKKRLLSRSLTLNHSNFLFDNSCSIQADANHPHPFRPKNSSSIPTYRTFLSHPGRLSDSLIIIDENGFSALPSQPETPVSNYHIIDAVDLIEKLNEINSKSILIFDCGSPFRFHENSIKSAQLLRVMDKISRKRLKSNPEKYSSINKDQLNQSNVILIYNDQENLSHELSVSLKCAYEEIQRCLINNTHRSIFILKESFEQFSKLYPTYCQSQTTTSPPPSEQIPPQFTPSTHPMTEILPHLFIGNAADAQNIAQLRANGIFHIVNVTSHLPLYHSDPQFHYHHIPADDTSQQNLLDYFPDAYQFIVEAIRTESKVLVHCMAGISRSPAIVISFLMRYHQMPLNDAYEYVKIKRQIIAPNLNFLGQLLEYEKQLQTL